MTWSTFRGLWLPINGDDKQDEIDQLVTSHPNWSVRPSKSPAKLASSVERVAPLGAEWTEPGMDGIVHVVPSFDTPTCRTCDRHVPLIAGDP
ncbi:hypothetical protein [Kribbella sp. C-35]|uniref:hypothetical protein n=1 Tax=Kribbella sp. C-35 TaxID=2789276 RepID=UPI00397BE109